MESPATQSLQPTQDHGLLSRNERLSLLGGGLAMVGLLAVAAWLSPDPSGQGTHRQLGLPGCTMYTILGMRCPGCGMTTSWAHTMEGDLADALRANTAGTMLCLMAMSSVPTLFWLALRGRRSRDGWIARVYIVLLFVILAVAMGEWVIRLAFG